MAALLFAAAYAFTAGSIVIRNADGSVANVTLSDGDRITPTYRATSIHFSTVSLEGEAIVRCRRGKAVNLGYVTTATHIWRTMRAADCRPGAPSILN